MNFIRNWKVSLPIAGVLLAGLVWLAFGFFGIHTAFTDTEVSEDGPTFATSDESTGADAASNEATETPTADAQPTEASEAQPTDDAAGEAPAAEPAADEPAEAAEPEIVTEASGTFAGKGNYNVVGDALVLGNGTGQRFLRLENFESSNGPDLNVYLFNPNNPDEKIDLGDLKGNVGDQNYEIPVEVDLSTYSKVSIYCVRFSTEFGSADLS